MLADVLAANGVNIELVIDPAKPSWLEARHSVDENDVPASASIVIGIGGVTPEKLNARLAILKSYRSRGCTADPVIHPCANVSPNARIEHGAQIAAGAIVQAFAQIGEGVIVNSGAIVEHDAVVGAGSHIAPGAIVLGGAVVGTICMIGAGSVILPLAKVPDAILVKALTRYPEASA